MEAELVPKDSIQILSHSAEVLFVVDSQGGQWRRVYGNMPPGVSSMWHRYLHQAGRMMVSSVFADDQYATSLVEVYEEADSTVPKKNAELTTPSE